MYVLDSLHTKTTPKLVHVASSEVHMKADLSTRDSQDKSLSRRGALQKQNEYAASQDSQCSNFDFNLGVGGRA